LLPRFDPAPIASMLKKGATVASYLLTREWTPVLSRMSRDSLTGVQRSHSERERWCGSYPISRKNRGAQRRYRSGWSCQFL